MSSKLAVATLGLEARGYRRTGVGQTGTLLRCVSAESYALALGWRAYIAPDPEDEPEGEIFMFCPECAEREFGPSGWEQTS
jgi:hypothetical protein